MAMGLLSAGIASRPTMVPVLLLVTFLVAERSRQSTNETILLLVAQTSVRIRKLVAERRHLAVFNRFRRFLGLILLAIPFREVERLTTFIDIPLDHPRHGGDIRVPGPFCFV